MITIVSRGNFVAALLEEADLVERGVNMVMSTPIPRGHASTAGWYTDLLLYVDVNALATIAWSSP